MSNLRLSLVTRGTYNVPRIVCRAMQPFLRPKNFEVGVRCFTSSTKYRTKLNCAYSSKSFHKLGPTQTNIIDVVRIASNLKNAEIPVESTKWAEDDHPRLSKLVETIRKAGRATDDIIDILTRSASTEQDKDCLENSVMTLQSACMADRMLFACTEQSLLLPSQDWHVVNGLIEELKAWKVEAHSKTTKVDDFSKTLVELLREPEATANELHSLRAKLPQLSEHLALERESNIRNTQARMEAKEQVKYLEKRLEQEAQLRLEYGTTEIEVLTNARYPQLLWALASKGSWSTLVTGGNVVRWIVIVACAIPFVVAIGAAPVWVFIMGWSYFVSCPEPPRVPVDTSSEDIALEDEAEICRGEACEDYHHRPGNGEPNGKTLACLAIAVCMACSILPVGLQMTR